MHSGSVHHSLADRLAASFLMLLMAIGSLVLWIGVPAASLYLAGQMTDTRGGHVIIALPLTLCAMVAFGAFLIWLNRLYLRITIPWVMAELDEDEPPQRVRGPLEPLLVGSLLVALVVLSVWFFVWAENPGPGGLW